MDGILDGGGFTSFERAVVEGTVVTLTAPAFHRRSVFVGWVLNGQSVSGYYNSVVITVEGGVTQLEAIYLRLRPRRTDVSVPDSVLGRN